MGSADMKKLRATRKKGRRGRMGWSDEILKSPKAKKLGTAQSKHMNL